MLRSGCFGDLQGAEEVRQRAILLIQLLNGALGVEAATRPLNLDVVGRIDDQGEVQQLTSLGSGELKARSAELAASGDVRDMEGNLIQSTPQPSNAQRWIALAKNNDKIEGMLVFAGRTDSWYDIYICIEFAEKLVGSEHQLYHLLGGSANEYKHLKCTANFYRHANAYKPPVPTTLTEAQPLLSYIVRTVLEKWGNS